MVTQVIDYNCKPQLFHNIRDLDKYKTYLIIHKAEIHCKHKCLCTNMKSWDRDQKEWTNYCKGY